MNPEEILIQLQEIITKLEERQQLIELLLVHDDPELVLLGQYQKPVVDECHDLLIRLVRAANRDSAYDDKDSLLQWRIQEEIKK